MEVSSVYVYIIILYTTQYDFLLIYGIRYGMGIHYYYISLLFLWLRYYIPIYGDARICICLQKDNIPNTEMVLGIFF